jgi:hypothetical protein
MKLTDEGQKHYDAFMTALKGVPAHTVARNLNALTPQVNWHRCSKSHIAECYAHAMIKSTYAHWPNLEHLDLTKFTAQCKKEI